ncbi:hypothetical protein GGX14DRAFT_561754 [Mycena pura]|uniref:KOW domain-containing protein n=1 Tax=Mycena pura TaxID=153505 RepID=A0AAD6VQI4_9AGAR|nr:hypothetical protein GGX14DRAFT_561754 [Mycena pura]
MTTTTTDDDEVYQGAMHALIAELDKDHYCPGTPPVSRSPSPPPYKRQRVDKRSSIPKRVLRLLDLEAQDESDTDDETPEVTGTGDFIDDEPNHELPVPYETPCHVRDRETAREDAELLRELAASFEKQAQEERDRRRRERELEQPADEDTSYFLPLKNPLHTFHVSSHWENRLVAFMATLDGIALVGTPGPSSRMVFFETSKMAAVANAARKWMWAHRVWFRGPQEIPPFEIAPLLNFTQSSATNPIDTRYNCFGRLKSTTMHGLYYNDLVFIDQAGYDRIWVVPRVHLAPPPALPNQPHPSAPTDVSRSPCPFAPSKQPRPPRRLFDAAALKRERPEEHLVFTDDGERCRWGHRLFSPVSGLEILPLALKHDVVRVQPREDEIELFMASKSEEIQAPFTGISCALQEGDRVLVVDERLRVDGDGGKIVAIFERLDGSESVRMAVISRPKKLVESTQEHYFAKRCFVQPVSSLRLHILSQRRAVNMGDRVIVVAGSAFRRYSGRIFDFPTPASIRFESLEPETLEVDVALRQVRLDFRRGDVVRVVRGEHKDKIGLIVALHLAGDVDIYICDSARINKCLRPSFATAGIKFSPRDRQACADADEDSNADEQATIRVATHDIAFVPLDNSGFQLPGVSSEWTHRSVQSRREAAMALDRVRHKWELDLMHTGRFVTGMFVMIIGKHPKKGQFGVIRDYRRLMRGPEGHESLSQHAEWEDIRKDVRILVQVDHSNVVDDLTLENVVERDSGLAVLLALLLQEFRKVNPFEQKPPKPREPSPAPIVQVSDLTEAEVRDLSKPGTNPRPDIGEITGSWLTHQNLIWKRIDVQVESLEFLYNLAKQPNVGNRVGPKVIKVASLCGYLRPFGRAVPARETGSFTLQFLARGRDAKVPIVALRPLRTTPVPGQLGMTCISTRQCRVIIIGPDVTGDCSRIGEYAETIPRSPPSSTEIVRVRFAWERSSEGSHHQVHAEYPIECLCHSLNQDTPTPADEPPVTRTDFDKKP